MNPGGWVTTRPDQHGGVQYINQQGLIHRSDRPAWEKISGGLEWLQHSRIHRVGGPAVYTPDNNERFPNWEYWHRGTVHREDGPALIWKNGRTMWVYYGVWIDEEETPGITKWFEDTELTLPLDDHGLQMFKLAWHEYVSWHSMGEDLCYSS